MQTFTDFLCYFLHYAISVLQNNGYKKVGIVSRQCLTFSVSGAENDLEYHLAAPRMLTNKNQIQLLS